MKYHHPTGKRGGGPSASSAAGLDWSKHQQFVPRLRQPQDDSEDDSESGTQRDSISSAIPNSALTVFQFLAVTFVPSFLSVSALDSFEVAMPSGR